MSDSSPTAVILVLDDSETGTALVDFLMANHYNVQLVTTHQEALERVATTALVEMVLLRLDTDYAAGLHLIEELYEAAPGMPILAYGITPRAPDDQSMVVAAINAGAEDFVRMPFRFNELAARIRALLRRAAMPPRKRPEPS